MTKVFVTTREGQMKSVETVGPLTLMEMMRDAGIDEILALCGSSCSCATCHIYVDDDFKGLLPIMSDDEDDLLESSRHRTANSRLSCQLPIWPSLDGLRVTIAPED